MLKRIFCTCFFIISLYASILSAYADLERYPQDFILNLQKIEIPGHPHAFNASIIRWNGSLLMSFRDVSGVCNDSIQSAAESTIGLIWLDDDFYPISDVHYVHFETEYSRPDDPRLIKIGDDVYLIYSDNTNEVVTEGGFRTWTGKLEFDNDGVHLRDKQELIYFEGEKPWRREKNWVPFEYNGALHLVYSIFKHCIFQPFEGTGCCTTVANSHSPIRWPWGEPRGGTPAIDIGGRYLTFFHSSIAIPTIHSEGHIIPHYFVGAYTFSNKPPFEITHISRKPIIAKGFYSGLTYPHYWHPVCVVFPCGILVEHDTIWMTYGRQDHEIWVAKIDKRHLLKSLLPVDRSRDESDLTH